MMHPESSPTPYQRGGQYGDGMSSTPQAMYRDDDDKVRTDRKLKCFSNELV